MVDIYTYLVVDRPDVRKGPTWGMPEKSDREILQDTLNLHAQEGWRYKDTTDTSIIFERLLSPNIVKGG